MPSGYQAGVNVDIKSTLILSFVTPPVQDDKTQSRKLNTPMKMPSTLIHNVRIFDGDAVLSSDGCVLIKNGLISTVSSVTPELLAEADEVINGTYRSSRPHRCSCSLPRRCRGIETGVEIWGHNSFGYVQ